MENVKDVIITSLYHFPVQAKKNPPAVTQTCNLFNDEQREKQEVEALARKYENKYVSPVDH